MMPSMARKYLTRRANQRHYSIITPSVLQTSTVKFAGESETFSRSEERAFARLEGWKSALVLRDGARAPPQHEGLQTSPLNLHHMPRLERAKTLARNFRLIQRRAQRDDRRLDRFIRQLKGAVVMRQRRLRAAIGQRFHGIRRVHVLVAHEPARLIGADRQDRQPQWAMRFGNTTEMLALAVTGIADDVEFARWRLEHKTCPQRLVAVERSGLDRAVGALHGDVVAERRDHAAGEFRG